jgi:hypothetical protein
MGMGLFNFDIIKSLLVLNILFTGPAFALSKTAEAVEGQYERAQHEYVLSSRDEVSAYCDAGDTLIKGECEGKAESLLPVPQSFNMLNAGVLNAGPKDYFERLIFIDSKEVSAGGRAGVACWSRVVRADEEVRISSFAKCKKSSGSASHIRRSDQPAS